MCHIWSKLAHVWQTMAEEVDEVVLQTIEIQEEVQVETLRTCSKQASSSAGSGGEILP